MKLTRTQLRRLINEAMIKPSVPNAASVQAQVKIDDLARQEEFQPDADSIAGVFGYPEDRSYSEDLKAYDQFSPQSIRDASIPAMKELGKDYASAANHEKGKPTEHYLKRKALINAAEICDSFYSYNPSMVIPLIDAFTDAANDYERSAASRIGSQPRFNYRNVDIALDISLHSDKAVSKWKGGQGNYADLYT